MAQGAGILNRVKNLLPTTSLCTLYNSFIFSHYSYGLEVWGACQPKFLKRLIGIQKKSVRSITKSHWLAHCEPRMKEHKILKIEDQHYLQSLSLINDMLKNQCPDVYNLRSNMNMNNSDHATRSQTERPVNLRLPSLNTSNLKTTFLSRTPNLWNELSENIKNAPNRKTFKTNLKNKILSDYRKKVECSNPRCRDQKSHP